MQRRKQLERKLEQQQNKIIKLERELTKAYEVHVQIQEEIDALDAKELFEAFKKHINALKKIKKTKCL